MLAFVINGGKTLLVFGYPTVTATDSGSQDDYAINNVVISNAPASCTVGEAPKAAAVQGDENAGNYTICEYWEEWVQTEEGMEPVKFWYSDSERMSHVPEDQKLTVFEEGKTYSYSVIANTNVSYSFASKDTLSVMLNGEDYKNKTEVILDGKCLMIGPGKFMTPTKPFMQKEVELIEISNATVSFKAGDKPVFTGTVPDGALYAIDYEGWFGADSEFISSSDYWNHSFVERSWCDGLITSFKANTEYTYQLYLKLTDEAVAQGYVFGPNTKLKVNGKSVEYPCSAETSVSLQIGTDLTMTPTAASTVPDYQIVEGANGTWIQNDDEALTIRANGNFSKFTGVNVDDTLIDAKYYAAVSGSTVVTLKTDYLKTLSLGTHRLTIVYTDGECSTNFKVEKAASEQARPTEGEQPDTIAPTSDKNSISLKTGDNSNLALWFAVLFVSGAAVLGMIVYKRKGKNPTSVRSESMELFL